MVKITRNSSCGSLCLPVDLACVFCKPTINRYILTGNPPKKIKKCIRPFDMKWKNHREQSKVDICNRIHNYINNDTKENTIDHTATDLSIDMICEDVGNNNANVIACETPIEDLNTTVAVSPIVTIRTDITPSPLHHRTWPIFHRQRDRPYLALRRADQSVAK